MWSLITFIVACETAEPPPTATTPPQAATEPGGGWVGHQGVDLDSRPVEVPLAGMQLPDGVLLWTEGRGRGRAPVVECDLGSGWMSAPVEGVLLGEAWVWWLPDVPEGARFRTNASSHPIEPEPVEWTIQAVDDAPLLAGEPLTLSLSALSGAAVTDALPLVFSLAVHDDVQLDCLDSSPMSACTLGTGGWAPLGADGATVAVLPTLDAPGAVTVTARLALADGPLLSTSSVSTWSLGRAVAWGDLHAHSNLSHDGCELSDQACAQRAEEPGGDFYGHAARAGVDFVANTEHAEWASHYSADGREHPVWDAQHDLLDEAGDDVIGYLGYEWTYTASVESGHKTVILEEAEACPSWRVRAPTNTDIFVKGETGQHNEGLNPVLGDSFTALWDKLDEAAGLCGEMRVLTFSHHTAWSIPKSTDWTDPLTAPDPAYEPVIEMFSEHASSECADLEADGCGWAPRLSGTHVPNGAVQTALQQGYRLGFVGGTDSHDGMPGTTDNVPSCTGYLDDLQDPLCHYYGGGLTGIYYSGALTRSDLFDAAFARSTLVTSGPRIPVRTLLVDGSGEPRLPGAAAVAGGGRLLVHLPQAELDALGLNLIEIAAVRPDNSFATWSDEAVLDDDLDLVSGDVFYLRIRLTDADGGEQRLWTSPWFID